MATSFLSSEEYDERAHRLYDGGEYDSALETLKEGLALYPHSVDLLIGLGYTRLAREEFVWAKHAFEQALVLEPEHEDALVGLGEALLRFGRQEEALRAFTRAKEQGGDLELLLTIGRALYREAIFNEAISVFEHAAATHSDCAEAAAALGYTLHRTGDPAAARRQLKRALLLDPEHHEARVYLAHLMYDRGDWRGALQQFERVPPDQHWDALAVARFIDLKRALDGADPAGAELAIWQSRLRALDAQTDPLVALLGDSSEPDADSSTVEPNWQDHPASHCVRLPEGRIYTGSWLDIVRQIRDSSGLPGESLVQFMQRRAEEERLRTGVRLPLEDPRAFVRAGARAGYWLIEY